MTTAPRAAGPHAPPPPIAGTMPQAPYCETCRQPVTDGLTGLLDRREWDSRAARAVAAARQQDQPVALILADLDRFKSVNDTYGHLAGDAVLRAVAGVLSGADGGIVGRYGGHTGDEFLILLPGATVDEALAAARSAQRLVRQLSVSARSSRSATVLLTGQTVSMGVAGGMPGVTDQGTLSELLLDSDVALRTAKKAGGDLACAADAMPPPAPPGLRAAPATGGAERGTPPAREHPGGALRISLASLGEGAGEGQGELVLSAQEAEHLHAVLSEMLGRGPRARAPAP